MDFIFDSGFGTFLGIVLTIVGMILLYVKIIPKKFDGSFSNKFFQALHDYFNFKKLYLESVLKFLFTLLTVLCIVFGALTILSPFFFIFSNIGDIIRYELYGTIISRIFVGFFGGIAIIILGTITIRLAYEGIMMFIILVKNVIDINNKTKSPSEKKAE